jgi:hypothetical protein
VVGVKLIHRGSGRGLCNPQQSAEINYALRCRYCMLAVPSKGGPRVVDTLVILRQRGWLGLPCRMPDPRWVWREVSRLTFHGVSLT